MMSSPTVVSQIAQRYQLLNQLGSGGMGVVHRALDRLTGKVVALKQVTVTSDQLSFATSGQGHDIRVALANEFKTLASLRHPNIISVLDYGFDTQQQPFFTMNLLEDAQTILEAGRAQPVQVQYGLLIQLLQAILYLHRRNILHRDVKPGNVLVVNGQVKVLDFGLSVSQGAGGGEGTSGTLAYMAPELLGGDLASPASDLYAVGVIAYELFAGQHPFRQKPVSALIEDILNCAPAMAALHQEPELTALIEELLNKSPEKRPDDAALVLTRFGASTGQQLPTETALTRESFLQAARFVGREAELNQLTSALKNALKGQGRLWLVGGESGIGKSRLLEEVRTLALVEGAKVLRGQTVSEGGIPYLIWREMLRQLAVQTELSTLEQSVLKALVPDIGSLLNGAVPDAPELDSKAAHDRLAQVICDVFARQSQPTVVILEDLQWAGSESISLLARLGAESHRLPLLIVGSYRSDERPHLNDELPGAHVLALGRLSKDRIADLIVSILGEAKGRESQLAELLAQETEGNVFFIVEALRALAEEAGQLDQIGTTALPAQIFSGGMKTVVRRRLNQVPESAQPLLQAAAVAGRQIDPIVLGTIDPNLSMDLWLASCADASVLQFQHHQWQFSHDKLREGLLETLSRERRQLLHKQVAIAIEQCYPNDPTQAAVLAEHWGEAGDVFKEAHYAGLAGEQSAAIGAHQDAIRLLTRADTLAVRVNMPLERLVQLRYLLGMAYFRLGNNVDAQLHLGRTLSLGGIRHPEGQIQVLPRVLVRVIREVIHRVVFDVLKRPPKPNPHSEVLNVLAQASAFMGQIMYITTERFPLLYYVLLSLAELSGPRYKHQQARCYGMMVIGMGSIPFHRAARYYQRLAADAALVGSSADATIDSELVSGMYEMGCAHWSEAEQHFDRCVQHSDQIGDWRRWPEAKFMWTVGLAIIGKWQECQVLAQETYEQNVKTGDKHLQAGSLIARGIVLTYQRDYDEAVELLLQGHELLQSVYDPSADANALGMLAQNYVRQGRLDMAKDRLRSFLALPGLVPPTAVYVPAGYWGATEAALNLLETGPTPENRDLANQTLHALQSLGRVYGFSQPFALLHEAWLAWLDKDSQRAVKIGEQAIHAAQQIGAPYAEALAHFHLGRHLPSADSRYREHLQRALTLFEQLGAYDDIAKTRELLL